MNKLPIHALVVILSVVCLAEAYAQLPYVPAFTGPPLILVLQPIKAQWGVRCPGNYMSVQASFRPPQPATGVCFYAVAASGIKELKDMQDNVAAVRVEILKALNSFAASDTGDTAQKDQLAALSQRVSDLEKTVAALRTQSGVSTITGADGSARGR